MVNKGKNRTKTKVTDPAKEKLVKSLIGKLEEKGVKVRREELKRGYGWRAKSGRCKVVSSNLVFVDSRLSQNEQIDFLNSQIATLEQ